MKTKIFMIILVLGIVPLISLSRERIKFLVIDKENAEPLASATVTVRQTKVMFKANDNGELYINVKYNDTLEIGSLGYASKIITLNEVIMHCPETRKQSSSVLLTSPPKERAKNKESSKVGVAIPVTLYIINNLKQKT